MNSAWLKKPERAFVLLEHRNIWASRYAPCPLCQSVRSLESSERAVDRRVRGAIRLPFRYIGSDAIRRDLEVRQVPPK